MRQIPDELAKAGYFDHALNLAKSLSSDYSASVNSIATEMANQAVLKDDRDLLSKAEHTALSLGTAGAAALGSIAVANAVLGRRTNDRSLLARAKDLHPQWDEEDMGPWEIAYAAGDKDAPTLLEDAETAILKKHQQGHGEVPEVFTVPRGMMSFAIAIRDRALQMQAIQEVESLTSHGQLTIQVATLNAMLDELSQAGEGVMTDEVLERFWDEVEKGLGGDSEAILQNLVRIGYLNRARQLAETRSGLDRTNCIAAIVLADLKKTRRCCL